MSLQIQNEITLDFNIPKIKNVRCVQNDKNSRIIHITITNNGKLYKLDSSNMAARYKISKPDDKYIYNEAEINEDGTVTINIPDQAMTVGGIAHSELQISDSSTGQILSTMPFNIIIEKSVVDVDETLSQNESGVINDMINHMIDKNNPHEVTKEQVGLGNVPDVTTNDQTPTYDVSNDLSDLESGEKLSVAFGKIGKAVSSFISHLADSVSHITSSERTLWNTVSNKVDKVTGKELSTNDLTATLKSNYDTAFTHSQSAHAPSDAEKNAIVGIQQNGKDLIIDSDRKVNVTVPAKTSELTNDSGFKTTDNNTTYSLSKSGSTITLMGSDGSITSVTDSNTTYSIATTSSPGLMSAVDKLKLDTMVAGAETNQYAFSNVTIGSTTIAADKQTDTLTLIAGNNITLTPDATNDEITIASKDTVYTHPTTAGNKHIPSGGSDGQILKWSADGTAVWGDEGDPDIVVTGVKGNAESTYRKGNVNITPENIGALATDGKCSICNKGFAG